MTPDRFDTLIEIHGGDLRRWPEADRAAAQVLTGSSPEAAALLADARALDEALDGWTVGAPSAALRVRILAGAPRPRAVREGLGWLWRVGLGAGLAASAAAGAFAAMVVMTPAPDAAGDLTYAYADATAFGVLDPDLDTDGEAT